MRGIFVIGHAQSDGHRTTRKTVQAGCGEGGVLHIFVTPRSRRAGLAEDTVTIEIPYVGQRVGHSSRISGQTAQQYRAAFGNRIGSAGVGRGRNIAELNRGRVVVRGIFVIGHAQSDGHRTTRKTVQAGCGEGGILKIFVALCSRRADLAEETVTIEIPYVAERLVRQIVIRAGRGVERYGPAFSHRIGSTCVRDWRIIDIGNIDRQNLLDTQAPGVGTAYADTAARLRFVIENGIRLQSVAGNREQAVVGIPRTGHETVSEAVAVVGIGSRKRANRRSRRPVLIDRRIGQGDICRRVVIVDRYRSIDHGSQCPRKVRIPRQS